MPRFAVGAMPDGAGEKDGSEGRGVIGEATLTRGVETLSGTFKATVLIVLDRAPTEELLVIRISELELELELEF